MYTQTQKTNNQTTRSSSQNEDAAQVVQQIFASPSLRVNTTRDVTGVEIGGALKNVVAIAAGIVDGLGLGNNALSALVAQGTAEIRWLAVRMGADSSTITGVAGVGDIMLTSFVNLSRNRTVGVRLGKGEKLEDILSSTTQVSIISHHEEKNQNQKEKCFTKSALCIYFVLSFCCCLGSGSRRCEDSASRYCTGQEIQPDLARSHGSCPGGGRPTDSKRSSGHSHAVSAN
jgi:uncharacterized membrane protein